MIFAGIDIGSRAAKAVIMNDCEIIGSTIQDTGPESIKTAYATIEAAMKEPGTYSRRSVSLCLAPF